MSAYKDWHIARENALTEVGFGELNARRLDLMAVLAMFRQSIPSCPEIQAAIDLAEELSRD